MGGEERPTMIKRDADGNIIPQVPATVPTDPGSTQPTATGVSTATAPTSTGTKVTPLDQHLKALYHGKRSLVTH